MIKVVYRKLGRHKADGLAYDHDLIEIDERLRGKRLLTTIIHEIMHKQHPEWSESMVDRKSREMASLLWDQGYRRIER